MWTEPIASWHADPERTSATIDEEGWLHTGDVAELDGCGRFKIIDRIKVYQYLYHCGGMFTELPQNIMKLAQGEYVALEKIVNTYSASPIISQIYVHGDSLQDHLVAIVIPDLEHLAGLASKHSGTPVHSSDVATLEAAVGDERVKAAYMAELHKQGKKAGLKGFETVKKIHLSIVPFTTENDTLTPTLKVKRFVNGNSFVLNAHV